jgi:hypothetical protein
MNRILDRIRASFGGRGASGFVSIGVVAALTAGSLAVVLGEPVRRGVADLLDGHTWLSNPGEQQLLLANGSSAQVDLKLTLKGAGHDLEVLRAGKTAVLVDKTNRQIGAIDLSADRIVHQQNVGKNFDLVAANKKLVVIYHDSGVVESRDPGSNALLFRLTVGHALSRAVVDSRGMVWVIDKSTGTLVGLRVDGTTGQLRKVSSVRVATGSPQLQITSVDGAPAVLDPAHGRLIKAPGGSPEAAIKVDLGSPNQAQVPASVSGSVLPIAISGTGAVVIVSGTTAKVVHPAGLASGERLGPPEVLGGTIYVPDYNSGAAVQLTLHGDVVRTAISVVPGGGEFAVKIDGGYAWFDNPAGDAKVADASGAVRSVDKGRPVPSLNTPLPTSTTPPPNAPASPTVTTSVTSKASPSAAATPAASGGSTGSGGAAGSAGPTPAGSGAPAGPSIAPQAPGQPTFVVASPLNASAAVQWSPADPHGSPVTGYSVTCTSSDGGPAGSNHAVTGTSSTVTGLKNGKTYICAVKATNSVGDGPPGASTPFKPTAAVPDTPAAPTAQPGDRSLSVSFATLSPDAMQGVAVTGYQVACGGVISPPASGGPVTVSGLVNGTSYTCTVTATTAKGPVGSPSSASTPQTPFGAPTVSGVSAQATGPGALRVSFNVGANGGAPSCSVTSVPSTGSHSGSCNSYDVSGLADSASYTWSVVATNGGSASSTATVVGTTWPARSIDVNWGSSAAGAPLTNGSGLCGASCLNIDSTIQHFPPNSTQALTCWSDEPTAPGDWKPVSVTTDSNGFWTGTNVCYFGFYGYHVYLHIGSVQSPTLTR